MHRRPKHAQNGESELQIPRMKLAPNVHDRRERMDPSHINIPRIIGWRLQNIPCSRSILMTPSPEPEGFMPVYISETKGHKFWNSRACPSRP